MTKTSDVAGALRAAFVREYTGVSERRPIGPDVRLEADLGVTADDGDQLLRQATERVQADLASPVDGIARTLLSPDPARG